jgi:hypothetical protein
LTHHQNKRFLSLENRVTDLHDTAKDEIVKMWKRVRWLEEAATELFQYSMDLRDFLWPLVHKVFPG